MFKYFQITPKFNIFRRNIKISNSPHKTHYEILNIPRHCTQQEIRNAFLRLTKTYHPDRSRGPDSHAKYVQILEAYKVLSNPYTRYTYNLGLSNPSYKNNGQRTAAAAGWSDGTIWHFRDKSQDEFYKSKPYYGIRGMRKISNFWVVCLCLGFVTFGVVLQIIAIRYSFTMRREAMKKKSLELEQLHSKIREQSLVNGNKKQLEILKEKMGYKDD